MEVKEGNEVIEAFYVEQGGKPNLKEDLWFYESSWDMLMPVVKKIRDLLQDNELYEKAKDHWEFITVALSTAEVKAAQIAVFQFITWYTSIKEKNL
jgi:hypothetical protein